MAVLQLEWSRCPDGVEPYEQKPVGKMIAERAGAGAWLRPRTANRVKRPFFTVAPAAAYVWKFVNAADDAALIDFCSVHGLPGLYPKGDGATAMAFEDIRRLRDDLHEALGLSSTEFEGPRVRLGLAIDRKVLVLALRPETLAAYMAAEVALILAGGSAALACRQCGRLFMARADATYCSNRCRVAAHRQKHR